MKYKIWSNEHNGWWNPNRAGYTRDKNKAGIYQENEALDICLSANSHTGDVPNESMVPLEE